MWPLAAQIVCKHTVTGLQVKKIPEDVLSAIAAKILPALGYLHSRHMVSWLALGGQRFGGLAGLEGAGALPGGRFCAPSHQLASLLIVGMEMQHGAGRELEEKKGTRVEAGWDGAQQYYRVVAA